MTVVLLSACATVDGVTPQTHTRRHDKPRTISVDPEINACTQPRCTGLGALWDSEDPANAVLVVELLNSGGGIAEAELRVDGKTMPMAPITAAAEPKAAGSLSRARRSFKISLATIRSIILGKEVRLKVQTSDDAVEDVVVSGSTYSNAYHSLGRFLRTVDES
jgi:hypothetical protein